MKAWKLVSGILSIVLFVIVMFQSCAGGIVSIATRSSEKKGGNIALIILFGLAAMSGFAGYGNYGDLVVVSIDVVCEATPILFMNKLTIS